MEEISAGGVIIDKGKVALLKKFRGDWVLPKGRIELGETQEEAALREVKEEIGINGEIIRYIGYVKYWYTRIEGEKIQKTVHYYYMKPKSNNLVPQKEEGFAEASYIHIDKAISLVKHNAEKNMIKKAKELYEKEILNCKRKG